MGTLSTELAAHLEEIGERPRIYADANVAAGLVTFMRERLRWDVFFVIEDDQLRRASDPEHYQMARRLRRTLVTFDRDFLDERRFPEQESGGVIVLSGPDEKALRRLLRTIDRELFGGPARPQSPPVSATPLEGRKLDVHPGWSSER